MSQVLTSCLSELVTLWQLLDRTVIDNSNYERVKHLQVAILEFLQFLFDITTDETVQALVEDWFERNYSILPLEVNRLLFYDGRYG